MKKIGVLLGMMLMSTSVMALDCAYTREQQLVRDAEIVTDLHDGFDELPANFDMNAQYACGGTLMQLATLRGNPDNMEYLLDRGANPNATVSLKGYEIPGAPDSVPFPLFVARYAPASSLIDLLLEYGADFHATDSMGRNVFWYFEQNPVLRNSYLTKRGYTALKPLRERLVEARDAALAELAKEEAEAAAKKAQ